MIRASATGIPGSREALHRKRVIPDSRENSDEDSSQENLDGSVERRPAKRVRVNQGGSNQRAVDNISRSAQDTEGATTATQSSVLERMHPRLFGNKDAPISRKDLREVFPFNESGKGNKRAFRKLFKKRRAKLGVARALWEFIRALCELGDSRQFECTAPLFDAARSLIKQHPEVIQNQTVGLSERICGLIAEFARKNYDEIIEQAKESARSTPNRAQQFPELSDSNLNELRLGRAGPDRPPGALSIHAGQTVPGMEGFHPLKAATNQHKSALTRLSEEVMEGKPPKRLFIQEVLYLLSHRGAKCVTHAELMTDGDEATKIEQLVDSLHQLSESMTNAVAQVLAFDNLWAVVHVNLENGQAVCYTRFDSSPRQEPVQRFIEMVMTRFERPYKPSIAVEWCGEHEDAESAVVALLNTLHLVQGIKPRSSNLSLDATAWRVLFPILLTTQAYQAAVRRHNPLQLSNAIARQRRQEMRYEASRQAVARSAALCEQFEVLISTLLKLRGRGTIALQYRVKDLSTSSQKHMEAYKALSIRLWNNDEPGTIKPLEEVGSFDELGRKVKFLVRAQESLVRDVQPYFQEYYRNALEEEAKLDAIRGQRREKQNDMDHVETELD